MVGDECCESVWPTSKLAQLFPLLPPWRPAAHYCSCSRNRLTTRRFWCNDCNGVASEECLDEHSISSLKRVRSQRAQAPLAELRAGEAALAGLRAELDSVASGLGAEVAASRGVLDDGLRGLDMMRQCLQDAIEADEAVFLEASRPTGLDGTCCCICDVEE